MPDDRPYTEADVELVLDLLPIDPDSGLVVIGWSSRGDAEPSYAHYGRPEVLAGRLLDALTAAGWRPTQVEDHAEVEFLRAELARYRRAFRATRDARPTMDAPEWQRLVNRAVNAGYEGSVVRRFQRKPDSLGHTNIVAAYQQGWRDCVALAETTRSRPVTADA